MNKSLHRTLNVLLLSGLAPILQAGAQAKAPTPVPSGSEDLVHCLHLVDGTAIFSHRADLCESISKGKFILLDGFETISLDQVRDFIGREGSFTVSQIDGKPYAFKLEKAGSRISLYSLSYPYTEMRHPDDLDRAIHLADTSLISHKNFFFQKDPLGPVLPFTFGNLRDALSDNAESTHQLGLAKTRVHISLGLAIAGLSLVGVGVFQTIRRNHLEEEKYMQASLQAYPAIPPASPGTPVFPPVGFFPGQVPPSQPPPPRNTVSPLIYAGGAALVSAIISIAGAARHRRRALNIYNGIE